MTGLHNGSVPYQHSGEKRVGDSGDTRTRMRPDTEFACGLLPAGVTHCRCDSAATGMIFQSLAKWCVKSGHYQTPPNRRFAPALYALC
jgi:hypothetical protein